MTVSTNIATRSSARRRLAYGLAIILTLAMAGLALTYRHYANPARIAALASEHLQRFTRGRVEVGSAVFSFRDGIRLFDVSVAPAPEAARSVPAGGQSYPLFRCEEVRLGQDLWSAVRGRLVIQSITAKQPTCTIVRNRGTGQTNLKDMFQLSSATDAFGDFALPVVELDDARVVVVSREAGRDRVVEDLTLSVRAMPTARSPSTVDVVWQSGADKSTGGHSQIELRTGVIRNVRGGLPWMSIEAVMLALNAGYDGAGAWCDLLGLGGDVRATDFYLDGSNDGTERSATVELQEATLSIPLDETENGLPAQERYLRFDRVNGEARLTPDGIRATFAGQFHGGACQVSFLLHGGAEPWSTLDDVGFEARMQITDLRVPRPDRDPPWAGRFIQHWRPLVIVYRDYDPDGVVDIEFEVAKAAGAEHPVQVKHARITAKGGTSTCRFFPYPFHGVTGRIEYTPEALRVIDLHGTHGDGEATVNAWLDAPTRQSEKHVEVAARGITLDEELLAALPARYRSVASDFSPRGHADATVVLRQPEIPAGAKPKWHTATTIALRDVELTYRRFPFPVEHVQGTISVDGDELRLTELAGEAEGGGLSASGTVHFAESKVSAVDVSLRAESVLLEGRLRDALPALYAKQLYELDARGQLDADARLSLDRAAPGGVRYDAQVSVRNGAVTPSVFPVTLSDIEGVLSLTPGSIRFDDLRGRYGDALVTAAGEAQTQGPSPAVSLTIRTSGLRFDERLHAALPSAFAESMGDWRLDGLMDTHTELRLGGGNETSPTTRTFVQIRHGRIAHARLAAPLEAVTGVLTLDGSGVLIENLHGRYGAAEVQAEGEWRGQGKVKSGELSLTAFGLALDEQLHSLLPAGIASIWDKVNPAGQIDVHLDRLAFTTRPGSPAPPIAVHGYVELRDVTFRGSSSPIRVTGTLGGSGTICTGTRGTSVDGHVSLASVTWGAHRFAELSGDWSLARTEEGDGILTLPDVQARLYGGALSGKIDLRFTNRETTYDASATLQGMSLRPFVLAEREAKGAAGEAPEVLGTVNAGAYMSGRMGDLASRRGGGRIEIVDGQLYRLPILLAILNVLNLSMPQDSALEEARAEFFLVADRMQFQEIVLRGDALALTGSGTMTLADRAVDWHLVNVGANTWARIPVLAEFIEGASRELVELHVTGPISQPRVQAKSFRAFRDEFKRLFQKRKPRTVSPSSAG